MVYRRDLVRIRRAWRDRARPIKRGGAQRLTCESCAKTFFECAPTSHASARWTAASTQTPPRAFGRSSRNATRTIAGRCAQVMPSGAACCSTVVLSRAQRRVPPHARPLARRWQAELRQPALREPGTRHRWEGRMSGRLGSALSPVSTPGGRPWAALGRATATD
jgi:hypothetical protein